MLQGQMLFVWDLWTFEKFLQCKSRQAICDKYPLKEVWAGGMNWVEWSLKDSMGWDMSYVSLETQLWCPHAATGRMGEELNKRSTETAGI